MAVGIVDRQKLVNIADAVRAKKGITGNMTLDAIASNITSMPTADNNAKFDFSVSKSSGRLLPYLTKIDFSGWDTSNITDMSDMFKDCSSLTNLDVSGFDTSSVTNMGGMFNGCSSLTSLDVLSFNTSKVKDYGSFAKMFSGCSSLKSLDLSNFDFSNTYASNYTGMYELLRDCRSLETIKLPSTVTFNKSGVSVAFMFYGCSSLTSLDLSGWNTSNVKYMSEMFRECSSLTTLDLSGWNTSNVTDMNNMFYYCNKLSNLTLGTEWASNSSISSFDLSSCPLTRESAVDVINKLATRDNSPVIKFSGNIVLSQSEIDVATNKGWSVSGCIVLVEDPTTATVGQGAIIDGVMSKCVYVADTPQGWGQRIFGSSSEFIDSNGNSEYQWGGYGTDTGINATDIGTGLSNTNSLIAKNLKSSDGTPTVWDAIKEFRSTYGDRWFIASRNEGKGYNVKSPKYIWTSSEYGSISAYVNQGITETYSYRTNTYPIIPFTYV